MKRIDTSKWAKFWKVSRRTVQNWVKATHPVSAPAEMARLIIASRLGGQAAWEVAQRVLGQIGENDSVEIPLSAVRERGAAQPGLDEVEAERADLDRASAWFFAQMKEAMKIEGNLGLVTYYHERFLKTEKARRDAELHARKLGLDEGQIIGREEFARLLHALAFWLARGVEVDRAAMAPHFVGLSFVEEVYGVFDRVFMRRRFLGAFEGALGAKSGVSLPVWALAAIEAAVEAYWETDAADVEDVVAWAAWSAALRKKREDLDAQEQHKVG